MNDEHEHDDFFEAVEGLTEALKEGIVNMAKSQGREVIEMDDGLVIVGHNAPEDEDSEEREDHLRFAALHRNVTSIDKGPNDMTDGEKIRAAAWRMMIIGLQSGHCVHFEMPWDLVDIADRLDLIDVSEGTAT